MNTITMPIGTAVALAAVGALGLSFAPAARAELRQVDQAVYGMDCAPCAFGVERRLSGLEGVGEVVLSLNEAKAVLTLEEGNRLTLHHIRDQIRRGGFSPRQATVEAVGRLHVDDDGNRLLATRTGEHYWLRPARPTGNEAADEAAERAWRQLQDLAPDQPLAVEGSVPTTGGDDERPVLPLHVRSIAERAEPTDETEGEA